VREGRAQDIPLPDEAVDGVFVADAFHWFDVDAALVRSSESCGRAAR
jgi:hypothetical protein